MHRRRIQILKQNGRSLVMFLIGLCVGGALFLFLFAQKLDSLYLEREAIYYANNQKYKEIQKLQEELTKYTQRGAQSKEDHIQKIDIIVSSDSNFGTETLRAKTEKMLEPFLEKTGEWVSSNPDLIDLVLKQQRIAVDEEKKIVYEVRVKYLSFYRSTLKVWIFAKDISNDGVSDLSQ
ncbi:hypothetical protein [Hazenella coriacea]|uniref:Uncharacterized protein n=1 Tax=Hazenella coriacea TaxID=1179467 RepID=A0A4R3LBT1_9BACL|nr:hypothetical protein [Hazenella coriacea]TCS96758.1 hypothetical protein EDD58_101399 [Hazenella coriacea]